MYPHFLQMKNREKMNENHKASLRYKLKKIKEDYIGRGYEKTNDFDFPTMSEEKFKAFKLSLEKERKAEIRKNVLFIIISFILGIIFMNYGNEIVNLFN
jgi:hypothetical protein